MENRFPDLTQEDLDAIAVVMDDDIREEVHSEVAPCHPGEFLTAYLDRDPGFPIYQFRTHSNK